MSRALLLALLPPFFLGGCATSGIMGRGFPLPLPGAYKFQFESTPPGAEISFNGTVLGVTPFVYTRSLLLQTFENTEVEARYPGHQSGTITFSLIGGKLKKAQNASLGNLRHIRLIQFDLPPVRGAAESGVVRPRPNQNRTKRE